MDVDCHPFNELSTSSAASETRNSLAHKWSMRSHFCKDNLDYATKKHLFCLMLRRELQLLQCQLYLSETSLLGRSSSTRPGHLETLPNMSYSTAHGSGDGASLFLSFSIPLSLLFRLALSSPFPLRFPLSLFFLHPPFPPFLLRLPLL